MDSEWGWCVWSEEEGKEADEDAGEGRGGGMSTVIAVLLFVGIVSLGKDVEFGMVTEGFVSFFLGFESFDDFLGRDDGTGGKRDAWMRWARRGRVDSVKRRKMSGGIMTGIAGTKGVASPMTVAV